jgi:DNA-binding transcriptional ArsR family regulator
VSAQRARQGDPFKALADPMRRSILELLHRQPKCSAGEIARRFKKVSRPAVSRHLRVLREARLVEAEGIGREQRYRLEVKSLAELQREWFDQFTRIHDASLHALKEQVEGRSRRRRIPGQTEPP